MLALTNERLLEVSTSTRTKIGIGKPRASTVSVALREIAGCDFRQGKLFWKNGGKNLVVVQTPRGEMAWATQSAKIGAGFAEEIRTELEKILSGPPATVDVVAEAPSRLEPPLQNRGGAALSPAGEYVVGPSGGSLMIRTGREGAAASAGHDLVLEVTSWSSTVAIGDNSSIKLTADPESIKVRSGTGGQKALTERDYREIEKSIANKVLGRAPITFTSSAVRITGNRMAVTGALSIAGRNNTVAVDLQITNSGVVQGSLAISQRSFGITPFKALMGALKVRDNVVIDIQANLPIA
ncbi:MAG: YceI family protein [Actinomycetota bacterium]|nr:YceI family protein [Actinomycetota bacterium]